MRHSRRVKIPFSGPRRSLNSLKLSGGFLQSITICSMVHSKVWECLGKRVPDYNKVSVINSKWVRSIRWVVGEGKTRIFGDTNLPKQNIRIGGYVSKS